MTKSITDIAREAGGVELITPSGFGANAKTKTNSHIAMTPDALERLEAAIKAAHLTELTQKREFPEGTFAFDPTDFLYQKGLQDAKTALLEGVEMPEPIGYVSEHTSTDMWQWRFSKTSAGVYKDTAKTIDAVITLDQCQQTVAAAVARSAEMLKYYSDHANLVTNEKVALTAELAKKDAEIAELKEKHSTLKSWIDDNSINERMYSAGVEQEKEIEAITAERDALKNSYAALSIKVDVLRGFAELAAKHCSDVKTSAVARATLEATE